MSHKFTVTAMAGLRGSTAKGGSTTARSAATPGKLSVRAAASDSNTSTNTGTPPPPSQSEREADVRAHMRRLNSDKPQTGDDSSLLFVQSDVASQRPPNTKSEVDAGQGDEGSAGNMLNSVVHSKAQVSERLRACMQQQIIYVADASELEHAGVGVVFLVLQTFKDIKTGAIQDIQIRILSVDRDGPADQGMARKGDVLVGVDGHVVEGRPWDDVRPLVEGPVGSYVNMTFQRVSASRPPNNASFGAALQAVSSATPVLSFSMRVLRGGHKVVRSLVVWPDPDLYTRRSLFVLARDTKIRRMAILLCESDIWDKFILVCILISSVLLVIVDPLDNATLNPISPYRDRVEAASNAFTILFAMEAAFQIIARGLVFGRTAYLKNGWNWMDFFVVLIGLMDLVPSLRGLNLTALRALRVLRPLRAIKRIEALKMCIETLFQSAPDILNVLAIVAFICLVFSIAGVQLLAGVLRNRCYNEHTGLIISHALCQSEAGSYMKSDASCPRKHQCLPLVPHPLHGLANFDSPGAALMSTVQLILLEGWAHIMYDVLDAHSPSFVVYFVVLILVGPFFTQLLFKAVLANCLTRLEENIHNNRLKWAVSHWLARGTSARAWNKWSYLYRSRARYLEHVFTVKCDNPTLRIQILLAARMWFNLQGLKAWNTWKSCYVASAARKKKSKANEQEDEDENAAKNAADVRSLKRLISMRSGEQTEEFDLPSWVPLWAILFYQAWCYVKRQALKILLLYAWFWRFSRSQSLEDLSTSVVALNVLSMTLPHTLDSSFGQVWPTSQRHSKFHSGLDFLNVSVAFFFILELLLKLWGWRPRKYFSTPNNVFDFVIVIVSAVEIPSMLRSGMCKLTALRVDDCQSVTNFMLLRVLRLLRLARVLRAFPNFQAQVAVAIQVFGEIVASFTLLCLFLMVYAILGTSLFGGKLRAPFDQNQVSSGQRIFVRLNDQNIDQPAILVSVDRENHAMNPWRVAIVRGFSQAGIDSAPHAWLSDRNDSEEGRNAYGQGVIVGVSPRSGFDTLLQSIVSVFQILGGSGWPTVMQQAIEATDMSCILYFYSLIFVGSFLLFNLFVAVIIVAFNRQKELVPAASNAANRMPWLAIRLPAGKRTKRGLYGRVYGWCLCYLPIYTRASSTALLASPAGASVQDSPEGGGVSSTGTKPDAPIKSSAKKKAIADTVANKLFGKVEQQKTAATLVGKALWKSKRDIMLEHDRRQYEEDERDRRRLWRFRPRSQMFDTYKSQLPARPRWVDQRSAPHDYVKGVIIDYSLENGYQVVYGTEHLVGFDLVETLQPDEMDERILQQTHLNYVQNEFARQRTMDSWQLGAHLAKNLETVVRLLEEKLALIRSQEQQTLQSTEIKSELQRVKSTYRIGRIMHLLQAHGRPDMTQALLITSPLGAGAGAADNASASAHETGRVGSTRMGRLTSQQSRGRVTLEGRSLKYEGSRLKDVLSIASQAASVQSVVDIQGAGQSTGFLKLEQHRLRAMLDRVRVQQQALTAGILTGNSCGCLPPLHPVRSRCALIITNRDFPRGINLIILGSCITMLVERPNMPKAQQDVLIITNIVFSSIFLIEGFLKITALGFKIYWQSGFNKLDLFIVVSSVADVIISYAVPESGAANIIRVAKILRVFRAVRPLVAVLRSEGLTVVTRAVSDSIMPLMSTMVLSFLVVAVFAIIGMELLQGALHYCSDRFVQLEVECVGVDAKGWARQWLNQNRNFDWFGDSWMTVFVVGTMDEWQNVFFAASDSNGVGHGASNHNKEWLFLYFFPLIFTIAFFQINMWTGVFVSLYFKAAVEVDKEVMATLGVTAAVSRRKWPKRPDLPVLESEVDRNKHWFASWKRAHGLRLPVKKFCMHDHFDQLLAACIVMNIALMSMQSFKPSAAQQNVSTVQNFFFSMLFATEVLGKMYSLHPQRYLMSGWYQFDYIITVISMGGIAIEESGTVFAFDPTILRILRIFRIIRIIKAAKIFRHAKRLFGTLEAMANVVPIAASLLLLFVSLILIFGVTGVVLFGHMCVDGDEQLEGALATRCLLVSAESRLSRYASFQNVGSAALGLLRVATADSWSQLMMQASLDKGAYPRNETALEEAAKVLQALQPFDTPLALSDTATRDHIAAQARELLGGCLDDYELDYLRARGLVDCSLAHQEPFEQACTTTCGNAFATVFYPMYLCISNFVLINLLLAVLMKQLSISNRDVLSRSAITERLAKHTFVRVVEAWRSNAARRIRFQKMLEKTNKVIITQDIAGLGQVLTLRQGQLCTMLGYWELKSHILLRTLDGLEGLAPAMYVKPYSVDTLLPEAPQPLSPTQRDARIRLAAKLRHTSSVGHGGSALGGEWRQSVGAAFSAAPFSPLSLRRPARMYEAETGSMQDSKCNYEDRQEDDHMRLRDSKRDSNSAREEGVRWTESPASSNTDLEHLSSDEGYPSHADCEAATDLQAAAAAATQQQEQQNIIGAAVDEGWEDSMHRNNSHTYVHTHTDTRAHALPAIDHANNSSGKSTCTSPMQYQNSITSVECHKLNQTKVIMPSLRGWVQRNEDNETNDQEKLQDIREKRAQVQAKLDLLPSHHHYPHEQRIHHNAQQGNEHQLLHLQQQQQQQNDTAKTARGELEGQGHSSLYFATQPPNRDSTFEAVGSQGVQVQGSSLFSPLPSATLHTHTHTHQDAPHMHGTSVGGDDGRGASGHGEQAAVANTAAATLGHVTSPADTLTRTHIHAQRRQEGAQERAERARARALARALRQQQIDCST